MPDRDPSSVDATYARLALARALFAPGRIALIGASDDPEKLTSRPARVLRHHGFRGEVVTIDASNPASTCSATGRIDHALVMTPATGVVQAIEQCGVWGIPVATILSAGFAESGARGARRQEALIAAARRAGVRILGPNSLGIVNATERVALSANAVFEHETLQAGCVSLVSQSGSMLGAIVNRAQDRGIGFSKLIAVGNEADITTGEVVDLLVDDADTKVILLFMEALRDATQLAAAARRAFDAGKPVVVYKVGRTATTRELAVTHTGASTDDDAHARAFFREHGILAVDVFETLFEIPNLVLGRKPLSRHRLATVTVSGGGAAMVLDGLRGRDVDIVGPTKAVVEELTRCGVRCSSSPVIDLPMGRADHGAYAAALRTLLASDHCDIVLAVQGSNAAYWPESVRERILGAGVPEKPLAVFLGPNAIEAARILQRSGIAAFRTPEACADAIRACCDWQAPSTEVVLPATEQALLVEAVRRLPRGTLNEFDAGRLIRATGIPVAPSQVVTDRSQAIRIDFPVAAKILSRSIPHKSAVGGVLLDIAIAADASSAIERLLLTAQTECPQASIDGVLVQTMQRGIAEILVGYRRSPEVGPVVILGVGGRYADFMPDRVVRCAPLSLESARSMIEELPVLRALNDHRQRQAGDLTALAAALHRLSLLALVDHPMIAEAEINPLILRADGVVAVDALARIEDSGY